MSTSDVSEFSSVSYNLMLILTLFRFSLKVPIIREARVYPLPQKITLLLCRGLGMSILDLGEFSFISYNIILILTLFRCRLKVPLRREARVDAAG
jgi:hypothetical protein